MGPLSRRLLSGAVLALVLACSGVVGEREHHVRGGEVYWAGDPVAGADAGSLESLDGPWARDARVGIYRNLVIEGSDGPSFEAIDQRYARDRHRVYLGMRKPYGALTFATTKGAGVVRIEAEPASFVPYETEDAWGHDATGVYRREVRLEGADPQSFRFLGDHLERTDRFLYHEAERVEATLDGGLHTADPDHWRKADGDFFTDGVAVWWQAGPSVAPQPIEDARLDGWEPLGEQYSRRGDRAWFLTTPLQGADAASLRVVASEWAVDEALAFHRQTAVPGVDPATLVVLGHGIFKDQSAVRKVDGQRIRVLDAADPATFGPHPDSADYYRDVRRLWYHDRPLDLGPDARVVATWAWDAEHVVRFGEPIDADPATFEVIDGDYARDAERVYFSDRVVPGADPTRFRVVDRRYGTDGERWWLSGEPSSPPPGGG